MEIVWWLDVIVMDAGIATEIDKVNVKSYRVFPPQSIPLAMLQLRTVNHLELESTWDIIHR